MNSVDLEVTAGRLAREVRYFQALLLVNLVYGAVALAISISMIVTTISPLLGMDESALKTVLAPQPVATLVLAALILPLVGKWFVHTTEMFDTAENLSEPRGEMLAAQNAEERAERTTALIVRLLSNYREHRNTIRAFRVLGKASGLLFIGVGVAGLLQTLLISPANIPHAVLSIAATTPTGLAGIYISYRYGKYQDAWDPRLIRASRAEEELRKLLGEP